ncbi:MAG: DUF3048 domain-containing protein [Candidatus Pacebacteria bacterium]|nr:DUF3048 domain-containing protein [Candidatus Paceibacterota bacterium]
MKKKHLIIALILYIGSALGSYSAMSFFAPQSTSGPGGSSKPVMDDVQTDLGMLLEIDPSAPKDQPCPLNGAYYTAVERQAWQKQRPLFVMIENHPDSRPQSGLGQADLVFEAVAEGGVTRFGAIYYCEAQARDITLAPVRSARTYYIDWASGFNRPMYVHVGGANVPGPTDALGQLGEYGWNMENDINQFSVGFPTFVRNNNRLDRSVATEHTMETSTERLWEVAEDRGWTNINPLTEEDWADGFVGWSYEDEPADPGSVTQLSYDFWSGYNQFSVEWNYDEASDKYLRTMGGEPHLDLNTNQPIKAANVIVIQTTEKGPINEKKHMIYGTTGTGDAYIFKHGQVVQANWSKESRTSELEFTDGRGNEIELARGLTWISVVNLQTEPDF